jgi:hypothetical protein
MQRVGIAAVGTAVGVALYCIVLHYCIGIAVGTVHLHVVVGDQLLQRQAVTGGGCCCVFFLNVVLNS